MNEQLHKMRHSLAHILASAVLEIYPKAKLAIGPAIDNGFYYDIDFQGETIKDSDLTAIYKKMKHLIKQNHDFVLSTKNIDQAILEAKEEKNPYKLELLENLKSEGEEAVSFYLVANFSDLCKGPHVSNTKEIKMDAFKLDKLAGAYWRGDEKNKMLTRIYGLAFETKEDLDNYLKQQVEAKERDHRKLGKELDLFHIDDLVGLGLPLWHPKGARLFHLIESFWQKAHEKNGYELVRTPHIGKQSLWETSGHWGFYNDSMYPPLEAGQSLSESQNKEELKSSEKYLLKPMNCPFHVQIYKNNLYSYRQLPLRWAECGTVYRFEKKGELSGLTRVRGFTQDDAHIICSADQVENELEKVVDFILFIYNSFGFKLEDIKVYLSVRDPENQKYAGQEEGWTFTEEILEKVAKKKKLDYQKDIGGAVFYGPKLDFKVKDVLGREWQLSTLQFDFNLPERFDMSFTNQKGIKERPYMLHRALLGSFERFIGLLIEHYAGAFPLWLAPVQIKILTISDKQLDYAKEIKEALLKNDLRAEIDDNAETIGNKIRKGAKEKIPYLIIIGDKEMKEKSLNLRRRGEQKSHDLKLEDLLLEAKDRIDKRLL